jgi:hypothetical protein
MGETVLSRSLTIGNGAASEAADGRLALVAGADEAAEPTSALPILGPPR